MSYDMLYLLTEIGLTPGGSSTVHIYTQTVHKTTQSTRSIHGTKQTTKPIHRTTQSTKTLHGTTQSTKIIHRKKHSTENNTYNNIIHWLGRVRTVSVFARGNSDKLWWQYTAKCENPLVTDEVYPNWEWCWEKWDLGKFNCTKTTMSCGRMRRLAVGMVEIVELVPGNGRRGETEEIWDLRCSWSVVIPREVEKSGIIKEKGAPHRLS
jgi:hypothetical protein